MNIWRLIVGNTLKAALVFSLASYIIDSFHPHTLQSHDTWKGTYALAGSQRYTRISVKHSFPSPDTTAVILNWSRLPNVVQIVKTMCATLQDTLTTIVIWNNNPQPLTVQVGSHLASDVGASVQVSLKDFESARCPGQILKIVNSPENIYFQARFIACSQAKTPYCFIQDDDYYIAPSIIRAMRERIAQTSEMTSLHLLPSHEMLFSRSSIIQVGAKIRTAFAWLGYGAMIHRSQAEGFLQLLQALNVTDDVWKMADNYFTVLANRIPEFWFDQNMELGGGQPFTVGLEGEERNNKHIKCAGFWLDLLVKATNDKPQISYPYVTIPAPSSASSVSRAASSQGAYIFKTNVELLLKSFDEAAISAAAIIGHVKEELGKLSQEEINHYINFSPSMAVDGDPGSSFQSANDATRGDWFSLDFISPKVVQPETEMAFLVDNYTRAILADSVFELTNDGVVWNPVGLPTKCVETAWRDIQECAISLNDVAGRACKEFRFRLLVSLPYRWTIYEVWMRKAIA